MEKTPVPEQEHVQLALQPVRRGPESLKYVEWMARRMFMFVPAQAIVAKWLESFKEFPPRHKAASFSIADAMDKVMKASPNQN